MDLKQLEELSLGELRERFPEIKSTSKVGFIEKLKALWSIDVHNEELPFIDVITDDCCDETVFVQNKNYYFTGQQRYQREDADFAIYAGSNVTTGATGPVTIWPGAKVAYYAGSEINIEPIFDIQQGAIFDAEIHACASVGKSMDDEPIRPNSPRFAFKERNIPSMSLAPNPSSGDFKIMCDGPAMDIEVYNSLGILVHRQADYTCGMDIHLGSVSKGLYLIHCAGFGSKTAMQLVIE